MALLTVRRADTARDTVAGCAVASACIGENKDVSGCGMVSWNEGAALSGSVACVGLRSSGVSRVCARLANKALQ